MSLGNEIHEPDGNEEKKLADTVVDLHPISDIDSTVSTKKFIPGSTTSTTVSVPKRIVEQSFTDRGTVVVQATSRISSHTSIQEVKSQTAISEPEDSTMLRILGRTAERRLFPSSSNIFMSIKSSGVTSTRLSVLLLTWMQTVFPKQV